MIEVNPLKIKVDHTAILKVFLIIIAISTGDEIFKY
jgi:hypothetical protein